MDTSYGGDVASTIWSDWHSIPWSDAYRIVGKLQTRITKAAKAGHWRKVRTLQMLLTRSTSAKALAVKRVTENQGRKTPGVDGQTWSTPEDKQLAMSSLQCKGYQPKPLRRIHIPKSNGGQRPLGIPTMKDRAMQSLHLFALDPVAETTADPHSYGFRKGRASADAITQVSNLLARGHSPKFVLEGDIQGCFDHISHDWLISKVCMDSKILQKWLNAGYLEKGKLFPTMAGTPQGGIISPVLANLALDGLQDRIDSLFKTVRESREAKVHVVRYADDFIITGSSLELLEYRIKPVVAEFLRERGLTLSESKTRITHVNDGFDFLGWNVRMFNPGLMIQPSKKNVKAFLVKVREIIRRNNGSTQGQLIDELNPVIRGWGNYHRTQMSSQTFSKCDHAIWAALWRWARRRHPNKGMHWVKRRYFKEVAGRDWRFGTKDRLLLNLDSLKKFRHIKIKAEANPYDPAFAEYFAERLNVKMTGALDNRRVLRLLWKVQDGVCPICDQWITLESGWHIHHIQPRRLGGTDQLGNLVLLHGNCHRQLHANEGSVSELVH